MRRWRWPWRYGRLRFSLYWVTEDVEVAASIGPTRWGPWRRPTPVELEQLRLYAGLMAPWVRQHPVYGDQMEAIVQLLPARKERIGWDC